MQVELVISFGDNSPVTLSTAQFEGLFIKQNLDNIVIKFHDDGIAEHAIAKLQKFQGRGVIMTIKNDNAPRQTLRGYVKTLGYSGVEIPFGKYPLGVPVELAKDETLSAGIMDDAPVEGPTSLRMEISPVSEFTEPMTFNSEGEFMSAENAPVDQLEVESEQDLSKQGVESESEAETAKIISGDTAAVEEFLNAVKESPANEDLLKAAPAEKTEVSSDLNEEVKTPKKNKKQVD